MARRKCSSKSTRIFSRTGSSRTGYQTDKEQAHLELLKRRFGDSSLTQCETMLQDVKDSKRITLNVHQLHKQQFNPPARMGTSVLSSPLASLGGLLHQLRTPPRAGAGPARDRPGMDLVTKVQALIVSRYFWPTSLSQEDFPGFALPDALEDALKQYAAHYASSRATRKLTWRKSLGMVDMTVHLGDREVRAVVSPVHAAVLAQFEAAPTLTLREVAERVQLPAELVSKRLGLWVSKGVLRETSVGVYAVQETVAAADPAAPADEEVDEDLGAGAVGSASGGSDAKETEAIEAFINGMLTNYQALPAARIHNFLQMFMTDPPYTRSEAQLHDLLTKLCNDGKLEYTGTNYALRKKD